MYYPHSDTSRDSFRVAGSGIFPGKYPGITATRHTPFPIKLFWQSHHHQQVLRVWI